MNPGPCEYCDLLLIDDMVPADFSPFRTLEYAHYLSHFRASKLLCTQGWHGWASNGSLDAVLAASGLPEKAKAKVVAPAALDHLVPRLAYLTFLNNAWQMFPQLQERHIPFVVQLYPGGGFQLGEPETDARLKALCASPLCRRIIVTQRLSQDYLLEKIGCAPEKVAFIYGGVYDTRGDFDFSRDKQRFPQHKDTLDICFVAHRYGDDMRKKGYDAFVSMARALAPQYAHLVFHVVGDYAAHHLPLGPAEGRLIFHGKQPNAFFREFYPRMDLILSMNRPAEADGGAFDGFPTGACMEAGFRGVLNCITDPLRMNVAFEDDTDIVLLEDDLARAADRIRALVEDPERMYRLAFANWRRFRQVFDTDAQLWQRCSVIVDELLAPEALVLRPAPALSAMNAEALPLRLAHARLDAEAKDLQQRSLAAEAQARSLAAAHADAERRHDNLLVEYRRLAEGFEALREHSATELRIVQEREDALIAEPAPAAERPGPGSTAPHALSRGFGWVRQSRRLAAALRAALARLAGRPDRR